SAPAGRTGPRRERTCTIVHTPPPSAPPGREWPGAGPLPGRRPRFAARAAGDAWYGPRFAPPERERGGAAGSCGHRFLESSWFLLQQPGQLLPGPGQLAADGGGISVQQTGQLLRPIAVVVVEMQQRTVLGRQGREGLRHRRFLRPRT